ncbi:MAG: WG repeat-containing protein [Bacteroidota bacterium]
MKILNKATLLLVILNLLGVNPCAAQDGYEIFNEWDNSFAWIRKDGKVGLLDSAKQVLIEPTINGEIVVINEDAILVVHNKKKGVYNHKGQEVLPPIYTKIEIRKEHIKYTREDENGEKKQGLCRLDGSKILSRDYCSVKEMRGNILAVSDDCKHSILIDRTTEKQLSPDTFMYIKYESHNRYAVSKDKVSYGIINIELEKVIPFEYQMLSAIWYNSRTIDSIFLAKKNNKYGLINTKNEVIIDFAYDRIGYGDGLFSCRKDGKWGLISIDNEILIDPIYDKLIVPYRPPMNYFVVSKDGKYGAVTRDNEIVLALKYDHLCLSDNGLFSAKKGDKWAIIDENGKNLTDFIFDTGDCYNDLFRVKLEGTTYYMNADLKCIQFCPDQAVLERYGLK